MCIIFVGCEEILYEVVCIYSNKVDNICNLFYCLGDIWCFQYYVDLYVVGYFMFVFFGLMEFFFQYVVGGVYFLWGCDYWEYDFQ